MTDTGQTIKDKPTTLAELKATRIRVRYDDYGHQRVDVTTAEGTTLDMSSISNSVVVIDRDEPRVEITVPLVLADVERVECVKYVS